MELQNTADWKICLNESMKKFEKKEYWEVLVVMSQDSHFQKELLLPQGIDPHNHLRHLHQNPGDSL